MTNDNNKINKLVSAQYHDPSAELEPLTEEGCAGYEPGQNVEAQSDLHTCEFEKLQSEGDDTSDAIASLKLDLQSRAECIGKLQFDIEQLRSKSNGLEKEIEFREEIIHSLTADLKLAHKNQSKTGRLLKKREEEIESLTLRLSGQEQSLEESARQIEKSRMDELESETRVKEIQAQLIAAEEKLATLTEDSRASRSKQEQNSVRVKTLSGEVDGLQKELATSRTAVSELKRYIDGRKADWVKHEKLLIENKKELDRLAGEIQDTSADEDNSDAQSESQIADRAVDAVRDYQSALTVQSGNLASNNVEVGELGSQIARTESYADELRRQLQDQLELTEALQARQNHLETSLSSATAQVRELSDGIKELRTSNALLHEKNSSVKQEFDKEVKQIHAKLGDAEVTIDDRVLLAEQLTSDLAHSRDFHTKLEDQLHSTEMESEETIVGHKNKRADIVVLKEYLQKKLNTKDNAVSALLSELTTRSQTIESVGEIEDVVHDPDDRLSGRIKGHGSTERERITRLLVGKIDGQELRFPLFKTRLTIGRTGHNDIQLKTRFISRRHAVIVTDDDITRIVDRGSKNGVFVNTSRIKDHILRNGDIVTIGKADFRFEERRKR